MTPEEYDKIRKDLDFIIQQTQAIHGFLFGNQEHENPARTQLRDLSSKITELGGRVAVLENIDKSNKVDKVHTMWSASTKVTNIVLGLIVTALLGYIIVGNLGAANPTPKTPLKSVESLHIYKSDTTNPPNRLKE